MDARRPFRICQYDPSWPTLADIFALDLRKLGNGVAAVHHIGSTAIPGLIARPVIDLLPVVDCMDWLDERRGRLETLGYEWLGENGIEGRRFCIGRGIGGVAVHAHFFKAGSPQIVRHLAFRDYLRVHPEWAIEYARQKRRAIEAANGDRHAYQAAKSEWMMTAEIHAMAWFSGSGQRW
jgi:GrpB-like predicted nucleotidyltransferase (UPF0157 family)